MANQREKEMANALLDAAWLTDGGNIFVRSAAFYTMPGYSNPDMAVKYAMDHNMAEKSAVLGQERIMLRKDVVERDAGRHFAVTHPERAEFSTPEQVVAYRLLANRTIRSIGHLTYITPEVLAGIDPEGIAKTNGWVGELISGSASPVYANTHNVHINALEAVVGITSSAASGQAEEYTRPPRPPRGQRKKG